ncbi:MAG TPA: ABC transporter ATP-binding protein [Candidatus Limnocylindria bacterium]|jgi:NitT/TauT family transport system ATP-binding protein|nr:ABC transporter ATP-binding protein [Candidatus Limnocylindria bacterium]
MNRIVVDGATKRFGFGALTVFAELELEVRDKETLCILGPSGCGKTTLLRCMHGLARLDDGRVLIDDVEVRAPRRNVAMVFQHFGLMPWKRVAENVAYGVELAGLAREQVSERVSRYTEMVGLKGFERSYPYQLSGGMQQRAGLARALALEPDILLMDEPFGSLDAQTREILQDELLRILQTPGVRGGGAPSTVVFITHSIEEAIALGDRIVVLTSRPARVRETITVDIPRPRTVAGVVAHPRFVELRDQCWRLLRERMTA